MSQEINLRVANGFRVIQKEETVDIATAGNWLRTRRQHRYTRAVREGDNATLTKHVVKCPYCGGEVPAYARFQKNRATSVPDRLPKTVIDEWASPQYSLFDTFDRALELNAVVMPEDNYSCPKCGCVSSAYGGTVSIVLRCQKQKITLSCNVENSSVLINLIIRSSKRIIFPVVETVEFNFGKGRASMQICDGGGQVLVMKDITFSMDLWKGSETYSLISGNSLVRKKLVQALKNLGNDHLPFSAKELTPTVMVSLTQFTGEYPKEFFDAIPYDLCNGGIERSFRAIAKKLHKAENLLRLYEESCLPPIKSVRKRMFETPGFFFYLHEVELLWQIFGDSNHFRRFLEMSRVYDVLSFLHQYPGAFDFIRDYTAEKGASCLLNKLERKWAVTQEYAKTYYSMSAAMQGRERKKWRRKDILIQPAASHSTPMPAGDPSIHNCMVDGYTFSWLRTKRDYSQAGKALRNCLGRWREDDNPVLVVKKGNRFKAAIEISCNGIVQEHAINNAPIEYDEALYKAVEKWKAMNRLGRQRPASEDDDEELWF